MPRPTQGSLQVFHIRGYHPLWPDFPDRSAHTQKTTGLLRFRSPLLAESRLMSVPPGTEMFQFPGFASATYVFRCTIPHRGWVAPFGHLGINACSRLPQDFRSVPRPSSPPGAKASTRCPSLTQNLTASHARSLAQDPSNQASVVSRQSSEKTTTSNPALRRISPLHTHFHIPEHTTTRPSEPRQPDQRHSVRPPALPSRVVPHAQRTQQNLIHNQQRTHNLNQPRSDVRHSSHTLSTKPTRTLNAQSTDTRPH